MWAAGPLHLVHAVQIGSMSTALPPFRSPMMRQLATALLGAIVIAGLTTLSSVAAPSVGQLTLFWPAAGVGFAMLCTQGRPAAWAMALGVGFWAWLMAPQSPALVPVAMLAAVVGPWSVWRKLQMRFAGSSQPFARQATMLAFLRVQALRGAPLSAATLTLGWWLLAGNASPEVLLGVFLACWVMEMCGTLLFAPIAWELLVARTRGGLPRFFRKVFEALTTGWQTLASVLLLCTASGVFWAFDQGPFARSALLLVLPLLAMDATRAGPLTTHLMTLIVGVAALIATTWGLRASQVPTAMADLELLWTTLAVLVGTAAVQILLVTVHERRLALKRLERQADTDPLTNLLSLSGLYRKIEELVDVPADPGDTAFMPEQAEPSRYTAALISVQMTNADSMEQLLGARQTDLVERATGGALTAAAPKVLWSRVSKAHFVGLMTEPRSDLDQLLSRLSFAVVESRALVDADVGRPLWTVAAVTLDADPLPPVEVIMACLRRTEQNAQDSRQIQITSVDRESAMALKQEAEQAERIRQIIQQKRLVLFAQPIVANVNPESLRHKYEILVRLRGDQGQIIPPGVFLPVAMRAGLMQLLDMAIMEQTFEWFAAHPKALAALSHCAINLSGPTVASPVIAQRIAEGLKQHQLPAHKFTFEITESQAIANPAQATDTIRAIRDCGCRVAIDDFGTGVATFDYLKRFDVDYIKIDGAFVKTLLDDPVDRVIVESIVKVAHQMQVRTVAEFVSSQALHEAVTALGVDESQGFVFGAPQPLNEWFGEAA
jgi:EAL domain-containing protein (putative c-di-GMP-specific phosphodiesterase class I)